MAVVRNIQNNDLYRYLGNNVFRNIRAGVEGIVSEEKAKEVFKINLEATWMIEEYPQIEELISRMNLRIDKDKL